MEKPRKVIPGDEITADGFNAVVEALRRARVAAGPGIEVRATERGMIIALSRAFRQHLVPAIVTVSHGSQPDDLPQNARYTCQGIGQPDVVVSNALPDFGRSVDGARVVPVEAGTFCWIVRVPDAEGEPTRKLWILGEKAASSDCSAGARGGGGRYTADELAALIRQAVAAELERRGL